MSIVMLCDVVETTILKRGCERFPVVVDARVLAIGSIANRMKWVLFALSLGVLAFMLAVGNANTRKKNKVMHHRVL
jgi:hypothetical protein